MGVGLLAAVDEVDARGNRGPGGQVVAAQPHRLQQPADHHRHRRAEPQRLLDHRVEIGGPVAVGDLGLDPGQLLGMAQQPLEDPRQRGRGRAVGQQGQQFVAQFAVAHRLAVVVAGVGQHRDDVLAPVGAFGAAPVDLVEDRLLDRPHRLLVGTAADDRAGAEDGEQGQVAGVVHPLGQPRQPLAHAIESGVVGVTENGADDHLLRDRLHPRPHLERLAGRPAARLAPRHRGHHLGVALHPLAVEGRQHQLATDHVLRFFQQHHRARPEDRPQQRVGDVDPDRVAGGEDGFDVGRVAEHDPVPPVGHP